MAHKVICPPKKIISGIFKISGILILNIFPTGSAWKSLNIVIENDNPFWLKTAITCWHTQTPLTIVFSLGDYGDGQRDGRGLPAYS
jgi:hypothetical protein